MTSFPDAGKRRTAPRLLWQTILYHAVMLLFAAIFLLPFYWMTISAFKTKAQIFADQITWFPNPIQWENVVTLVTRDDFPFVRQFMNSVFYSGSVALAVCFSCSLAAYSFGCLRWRGRNFVFILTVCALLLPGIATFLPTYIGWSKLGFNGTYVPLIAPALFGDAFFIFMLRQFFLGVPRELLDAARLDGASEFRIWWQIVMPQVRTALIIVALFAIVYTWNEFFGPLIYLHEKENFPLSVGLFTFQSGRSKEWPLAMAGAFFTALPMVVLFLFTQRLFRQGLNSRNMK